MVRDREEWCSARLRGKDRPGFPYLLSPAEEIMIILEIKEPRAKSKQDTD